MVSNRHQQGSPQGGRFPAQEPPREQEATVLLAIPTTFEFSQGSSITISHHSPDGKIVSADGTVVQGEDGALLLEMGGELRHRLDDETQIRVSDWVVAHWDEGLNRWFAAAEEHKRATQQAGAPGVPPGDEATISWGYDDAYFGPILRSLVPRGDEGAPTKEQFLRMCRESNELEQDCVQEVWGTQEWPPEEMGTSEHEACFVRLHAELVDRGDM